MITRRILRPATSFISSPGWTCTACARQQMRRAYTVPALSFQDSFVEYGVPGLLSAEGYKLGWTQYQDILVQKLNELTAGERWENSDVKSLALQFARDPMNASLFNHASMAFNNHFFFNTLSTAPTHFAKTPNLLASLETTFGSMDNLRTTMLEQASGMFGPGFVWLVWARDVDSNNPLAGSRTGSWRLLNTYLAGTPFPEAGYRQQSLDMANTNAGTYNSYLIQQPAYLAQKIQEQRERAERETAQRELDERNSGVPYSQQMEVANSPGAFGRHSQQGQGQARLPPGGTSVMPVLCVNTWEHVWIYDYGLAGKRKFLSDWWDAVDWGAVEQNAPQEAKYRPAEFQRF